MKTFKIEICGNVQMAGSDARALERLENQAFDTEAAATKVVNELAADWANPAAIWDIVAIVE